MEPPRRAEPGQWLLKGLVKCGVCGVGTNCHKTRGRNGTWHRYYYCRNHDPLRAGGQEHRCPERNIRADALDEFVFDQIKRALLQPDLLLAGEHSLAVTAPVPDDQLLAAELARLDRKLDTTDTEKRRLVDLYQAGLIEMADHQRRAADIAARHRQLQAKRTSLADQRAALVRGNQIHRRVHDFAERIRGVIDQLDAVQKQQLLRLLIEEVHVTGWHVEIRLRIALDQPPPPDPQEPDRSPHPNEPSSPPRRLSSEDGLRSVSDPQRRHLQTEEPRPRPGPHRTRRHRMNPELVKFHLPITDQISVAVDISQAKFDDHARSRHTGIPCKRAGQASSFSVSLGRSAAVERERRDEHATMPDRNQLGHPSLRLPSSRPTGSRSDAVELPMRIHGLAPRPRAPPGPVRCPDSLSNERL